VNLDKLQELVDNGLVTDTVDFTVLVQNRLATKNEVVKILGRGELKAKLKVSAHKFTATAKAAIEAAGGEAVTL
jgi:large subunit ribosomal protein L15